MRKGPTKATLEDEVRRLAERNVLLETENRLVKQFTTAGSFGPTMASMIIALEKVTEALSHVISDIKQRR